MGEIIFSRQKNAFSDYIYVWMRNVASVLCYRHTRYSAFFVYIGVLDRCEEEIQVEKEEQLREIRQRLGLDPPKSTGPNRVRVVQNQPNMRDMPDLLTTLPKA